MTRNYHKTWLRIGCESVLGIALWFGNSAMLALGDTQVVAAANAAHGQRPIYHTALWPFRRQGQPALPPVTPRSSSEGGVTGPSLAPMQAGEAPILPPAAPAVAPPAPTPAIRQQPQPAPMAPSPALNLAPTAETGSRPVQVDPARALPASRPLPNRPQVVNSLPPGGYRPPLAPMFAQGEYVDRSRTMHVPSYRLRVDDEIEFVYRVTRIETSRPYEINVGDELKVEVQADPQITRPSLVVQPDGTITLVYLGQVRATRRTVAQLRDELEEMYRKYYPQPSITVTPIKVNSKLEDLRNAVLSQFAAGGQTRRARITPEGTVQLPALGSFCVQGLTLDELTREVNARYAREIEGIEVIPVLLSRAPRFVYVIGEVRAPGRYTLEAPTSVMQAISLAGGWNVGANLWQVVVFRRDDNWQMMATMLNLWGPLYGDTPCAADDIWVGDSDIVVVPKMKILVLDEFIDLIFTRGIYGVVPFQGITINMAKLSTL